LGQVVHVSKKSGPEERGKWNGESQRMTEEQMMSNQERRVRQSEGKMAFFAEEREARC
jgi:hypothetical protein